MPLTTQATTYPAEAVDEKTIPFILLTVICVGSCWIIAEKDTRQVKDTILRYNYILAERYAGINMTPLR
jgi:hypothetical protein